MASLATIFNSPYYFGEISFEETKKILSNKPPNSYLFRKLKNGSITLAILKLYGDQWCVIDVEIKNCNCEGILLPIQQFKSLEDCIENCNFVFGGHISGYLNFKTPVFRKDPFSLEEMSKSCILANIRGSIDNLNLPTIIKQDLKVHHNHFEIMLNEKKAIKFDYSITNCGQVKFTINNLIEF